MKWMNDISRWADESEHIKPKTMDKEELEKKAKEFFHRTPHGYIYRTNEARGFMTDYKDREIVGLMAAFALWVNQQEETGNKTKDNENK